MRRLLPATLIFLLLGPLPGTAIRFPGVDESQRALATPVGLAPVRSGSLRFVRGWRLQSPNSHFGGFSALARPAPGRFLLVSDNGYVSRLALSPAGALTAFRIDPLPAPPGKRPRKLAVDYESFAFDPVSGRSWAGLENVNQIWRLDPRLTRVEAKAALPDWPSNSGPEALVRFADGRIIVFSEHGGDDPRGSEAVVYRGDPAAPNRKAVRFFYDTGGRGRVSDAAPLPDGRILLVHRRLGFDPVFTTILAVVDPADIAPGAVVRSVTIGRVPRTLADNFEGAAVAAEGGRTWLWLVSDNNFNVWQRSLLLQFELVGLPPRRTADGNKAAR